MNNVSVGQDKDENLVVCTLEARQCPDGSFVGRQGPLCAFSICPPLGLSINESVVFGDTTITPRAVVEDSRCRVDEACVWAGTFSAEVSIVSTDVEEVRQLSIGDEVITNIGVFVLESVSPQRTSSGRINEPYQLFFVERR